MKKNRIRENAAKNVRPSGELDELNERYRNTDLARGVTVSAELTNALVAGPASRDRRVSFDQSAGEWTLGHVRDLVGKDGFKKHLYLGVLSNDERDVYGHVVSPGDLGYSTFVELPGKQYKKDDKFEGEAYQFAFQEHFDGKGPTASITDNDTEDQVGVKFVPLFSSSLEDNLGSEAIASDAADDWDSDYSSTSASDDSTTSDEEEGAYELYETFGDIWLSVEYSPDVALYFLTAGRDGVVYKVASRPTRDGIKKEFVRRKNQIHAQRGDVEKFDDSMRPYPREDYSTGDSLDDSSDDGDFQEDLSATFEDGIWLKLEEDSEGDLALKAGDQATTYLIAKFDDFTKRGLYSAPSVFSRMKGQLSDIETREDFHTFMSDQPILSSSMDYSLYHEFFDDIWLNLTSVEGRFRLEAGDTEKVYDLGSYSTRGSALDVFQYWDHALGGVDDKLAFHSTMQDVQHSTGERDSAFATTT